MDVEPTQNKEPQDTSDQAAGNANDTPVLTNIECRLLGALMEKQLSTPDSYPLTINSLISAANQKSNREPVSHYQKGEVVRTLRALEERKFVRYEMGARSERYEQKFTQVNSYSKKQQALLSVMMLRGPQTVNELQTRTQRLYEYTDRNDMLVSLERLTQGDNPVVVIIPPQSGQREERYAHSLCGAVDSCTMPGTLGQKHLSSNPESLAEHQSLADHESSSNSEIDALKQEIKTLRKQLHELYELTGHTVSAEK